MQSTHKGAAFRTHYKDYGMGAAYLGTYSKTFLASSLEADKSYRLKSTAATLKGGY